jgi:vacuole membrane protein 1
MTAYTCKSLAFHTRGDDPFVCLRTGTEIVTILGIWSKVYLEVFFWGAGTAIGELPPFFIARAGMVIF